MKKKIVSVIFGMVSMALVNGSIPIMAQASELSDEYSISSVEQLKQELNKLSDNGKLTKTEISYLENQTNPPIMDQLLVEKMNQAIQMVDNVEVEMLPIGNDVDYGITEVDLGDGCYMIVELTDQPEGISAITDIGVGISPCSSLVNSGSAQRMKEYGNRYFTTQVSVVAGAGKGTFILENHYNLSVENVITERYGIALTKSVSFGGTITYGTPTITQKNANKYGSSASMYCTYQVNGSANNVNYSQPYKLVSSVKYISQSLSLKMIEIQENWSLYTY